MKCTSISFMNRHPRTFKWMAERVMRKKVDMGGLLKKKQAGIKNNTCGSGTQKNSGGIKKVN